MGADNALRNLAMFCVNGGFSTMVHVPQVLPTNLAKQELRIGPNGQRCCLVAEVKAVWARGWIPRPVSIMSSNKLVCTFTQDLGMEFVSRRFARRLVIHWERYAIAGLPPTPATASVAILKALQASSLFVFFPVTTIYSSLSIGVLVLQTTIITSSAGARRRRRLARAN
jgi:hypothetical protein